MQKLALLFAIAIFTLASCSSGKHIIPEAEKLVLNDSLQKVITIDTVKLSVIMNELNLSGKVTFDQEKIVEIFPMLGGNVTEVRVELGDYVKKGETLAIIKSSEVADYEKQAKEAQSHLLIAQKNLDVAIDMNQSGLMSQRDILLAEKELENAQAELNKINEVFAIYNIADKSQYTVKSPVSGFVVEKNINREMQIRSDNNTEIFTISGLEDVWVLANVYESDINKVKAGDQVQIKTPAYNNMLFSGTIDKVYNVLNNESKTMTIRIKLQNTDYLLKPGMFASVKVIYTSGNKTLPCVNEEAIIFNNGKNYVVVVQDDKNIEVREVQLYSTINGIAAIESGLSENEKIINKNALLVYNALITQ